MEKWFVQQTVGNRDQRKDRENEETYDGMCEKCSDAGWGKIDVYRYFTRSYTRIYDVT